MSYLLNCHHFHRCHHFRFLHRVKIRHHFEPERKMIFSHRIFSLVTFLTTCVGDTVGDEGISVMLRLRSIALVTMTSTSTRARLFKNIFGEFWNCRLIVLSSSKTDVKSRAHFTNGLFGSILIGSRRLFWLSWLNFRGSSSRVRFGLWIFSGKPESDFILRRISSSALDFDLFRSLAESGRPFHGYRDVWVDWS